MSDLKLTLGDFIFQNSEIPQVMPFGGDQHLVRHDLVGGGRIIDAMGRSDAALEWSGIFLGQTAVTRAKYLDGLRIAGAQLKLTWHQFAYMVVIRSFHAPFERFYKIPYTISCEVVQDLTKPVKSTTTKSILGMLQDDLALVNNLVNLIADNPLTQAVSQFAAALSLLPGGSKISKGIQQKLIYPLQSAQQRTNTLIGSTNSVLQAGSAVGSAVGLSSQETNMQTMGNLLQLDGLLGRMNNNIGVATGGATTVPVGGGNLFDTAAKQYGDPTQWTTIANANNIADPFNVVPGTLQIPAMRDTSGGVLPT